MAFVNPIVVPSGNSMGVVGQWVAIIWKDVYIQAIKRHYLVTVIEVALIIISFIAVEKDRPILSTDGCNQSQCLRVAAPKEYPDRTLENFTCPQLVLYTPPKLGEKLFAAAFKQGGATGSKVRVAAFNSTDAMLIAFDKLAPKPRRGPEQRVVAVTLGEHAASKNGLSFTVSFYDEFIYLSKRLNGYALFSTLPNPVTQRESVACLQLALGAAHIRALMEEKKDGSKAYEMSTRRFTEGPHPKDDISHRWLMILRLGVGYLVPFCLIVARVVQETQQGMREQLRLRGLHAPVYRSGHWLASFFTGTVSFAINMAYMAGMTHSDGKVSQAFLDGTSKLVVLISFVLYTSQYVSKAMLLALFFTDTTSAVVFSAFYWHVSFLLPALWLEDIKGRSAHYIITDRYTKLLTASLPCVGLHWCFRIIGSANVVGEEYTLASTASPVLDLDNVTMTEIWTVMLVDSLINIIVGWYLSHVLSWYIGVPYKLWFPFLPSYWLSSSQGNVHVLPPLLPDNVHFEADPPDKEGLVFVNRVEYAKKAKHILRDINFKAYEGEILAVLGPSGSGKSTLFNIICGNAVATGGQVIVNGFDVALQTRRSREQLGVVHQRDVLFHDLTVTEHLSFFGALGGLAGTALENRIAELLDMFYLVEVADLRAGKLQTAQKRRLALAMAVVCGPKVLILDEPMHSMDSTSRAKMWEVLTKMKPTTCIILTTNDVTEVEAYADRISILGCGGAHKCHGHINFIQSRYGAGYNVRITKAPKFETRRTLMALKAVVPECRVLQDHRNSVILSLGPRSESATSSAAIALLERDQKEMCIESIKGR
ncbi:phospholipid-transporting ATPase ABCA3-like [Haemaphysalis longicornis]